MPPDPRAVPGRYTIRPIDDCEWRFYWNAFLGDERVNGGVCSDCTDGSRRALRAITEAREALLKDAFYWDVETFTWVPKGELPL